MITDHQKTVIRHLWERAQQPGYQLVTFYQDHFYTRNGKFGYPCCVQLQNVKSGQVEDARILHWSSSQAVCADKVEAIDAYIATLDAEAVK
jgi:hypothetical protein